MSRTAENYVGANVDQRLYKRLERESHQTGIPMAAIIRKALAMYYKAPELQAFRKKVGRPRKVRS